MVHSMLFLAFLAFGCSTHAYKILIMHLGPSYSHQQPIMRLTQALVDRGHHVFAVTPNVVPGLKDNYTHVDLSFSYKLYAGGVDEKANEDAVNLQKEINVWELLDQLVPAAAKIPEYQFQSEEFLKFFRKVKEEKLRFDVVLGQSHYIPFICGITRILSSTFSGVDAPPIISISTFPVDCLTEEPIGSFIQASFFPHLTPYSDRMSLWQKMFNWVVAAYLMPNVKRVYEESARTFFEETYGPQFGGVTQDCWGNVSLVMNTGNFLYGYPRSVTPNVIELGPLHLRKPEPLSQILQDWLDGAEKGVIYMSLGSNKRSTSLSPEAVANIVRVFNELPTGYRVLWKWEADEKVPGQSDNILAQKWLPQQAILAHPKVKLFIMQGGFQSFQEAVHYGVPTVGIPWFADQVTNVVKMEVSGIGVGLWPQQLHSYEGIKSAIINILTTESYGQSMKRLSEISQDFTQHSMSKAIFWIEHVAKHKGASHLRPSTADASYFQYFCLDIICVLLTIFLLVAYIVVKLLKFLLSIIVYLPSKMKIKKS